MINTELRGKKWQKLYNVKCVLENHMVLAGVTNNITVCSLLYLSVTIILYFALIRQRKAYVV